MLYLVCCVDLVGVGVGVVGVVGWVVGWCLDNQKIETMVCFHEVFSDEYVSLKCSTGSYQSVDAESDQIRYMHVIIM